MQNPLLSLTLIICTTAHFVITAVMSLYARHRVKYLSIAWIMGIFSFALLGVTLYVSHIPAHAGMLHPSTLIMLVAATFLQSIYPLSIPMPAYLQWERMWRYALPAISLIIAYGIASALGMKAAEIRALSDVPANLLRPDMLLRVLSIALSLYYIINILRLPRKMSKADVPTYLKVYSTLLGLNALFFVGITFLPFNPVLNSVCLSVFTLLNLYQCLRALESMALELPKPITAVVEQEPAESEIAQAENDFNEANLQRFKRIEHWMQHNPTRWQDNTFGRDQLCRETGFNRHLLLQSVRSQGYNNTHDYINSYRIKEVKRLVESGLATNLTECLTAGFGAVKTLRACFLREEGITIDEFLGKHK